MRLKGNCIILSDSNVCRNRLLNILLSLQRTTTEEATISLSGGGVGIFCSDSSSFGRRNCFPSNFNKDKRQTEILDFFLTQTVDKIYLYMQCTILLPLYQKMVGAECNSTF